MQFSQQLVSQCHCETSCWRITQCNIACLAIFLLREALHEVELSSTFRNGLQQLATPLHSVSPLQQLVSQFYDSFNKGACAYFLFFFSKSTARQVAEKIAQCNMASTLNLGNLQRYISTIARQVAEKIAQCNRAFTDRTNKSCSHGLIQGIPNRRKVTELKTLACNQTF